MAFDRLQQTAFRIRTDVPWQRHLFMLRFPENWKTPLTTLGFPRRDGKETRSVPIALLNRVITALVPDVITVATRATIGDSAPWIYSDTEIDTDSLFAIIATWIRASAKPEIAEAILREVSVADLRQPGWEALEVDFSRLTTNLDDDPISKVTLLQLLPHVIAAELAAPGAAHEHLLPENPDADLDTDDNTPVVHARSEFRRCPTGEDSASVISWPPHYATRKPMSFLLSVSTQSHAFTSEPTIHLRTGVRRWAHREPKLSFDSGHTLYLLPSVPWLPGIHHSRSFLTAPIESWKKDAPNTDSGFEYSARWGENGKLGRILRELGCTNRLPDPENIKKTPAAWLGAKDTAALVYKEGMYPTFSHPVSAGTSLADKVPLVTWVAKTLANHVEPVAPLKKGRRVVLARKAIEAGKYSATDQKPLREAIAAAIKPQTTLGIEIFWDTTHTRDYARRALADMLDIDVPEHADIAQPVLIVVLNADHGVGERRSGCR
jgi:hypothetical protein